MIILFCFRATSSAGFGKGKGFKFRGGNINCGEKFHDMPPEVKNFISMYP